MVPGMRFQYACCLRIIFHLCIDYHGWMVSEKSGRGLCWLGNGLSGGNCTISHAEIHKYEIVIKLSAPRYDQAVLEGVRDFG